MMFERDTWPSSLAEMKVRFDTGEKPVRSLGRMKRENMEAVEHLIRAGDTDRALVKFWEIAALYVAKNGPYFGIEGVDPWDEERDARTYTGPHPVVAHPPCQRWGKFWRGQPGNIAKGKVEKLGDDGGCFADAIAAVRHYGGVLEHPEGSKAWDEFGLSKPPREGGWIPADLHGGHTCRVEQGQYGHYCPKPTWLYAVGIYPLPELRWGVHPATDDDFRKIAPHLVEKHGIGWCRRAGIMAMKGGGKDSAVRIHTPEPFRNLLIALARSASS